MIRLPFTPAEIHALRKVRERAMVDAGDNAPMRRVWWTTDQERRSAVIPWLVALNLEVA